MNYKIAADSSSNLCHFSHPNFVSVPLKVVTDQREFVDDEHLDVPEMMEFLASYQGRSGTSCPNVGEWLEAFEGGEGVFALSLTGTLSGAYNACVQARDVYEENHPDRRVCCLDTLSAGPELALQVEKLLELTESGRDFDAIEAGIKAYMKKTHLVFLLESLSNMEKNGRVSHLVAKTCGLLGIRIQGQASSEGTLEPLHKCRGEKKGLATMYKVMRERGYQGGKVRIAHCCNQSAAEAFAELVRADFPQADLTIAATGGLCSFYAEQGGLMVGFEE